jgi:esterase
VTNAGVATRQQAATVMREFLHEEGVIQFLLKSFVDGAWRFNVPVLGNNTRTLLAGKLSPRGISLPCLFPAAIRRMLPKPIETAF